MAARVRYARRIARKVALILFSKGSGDHSTPVTRLEQKVGRIGAERAVGGWAERPVRDVIERVLLMDAERHGG